VSLSEKIKNRYGSKRGLLRYIRFEIFRLCGAYRSLKKIDFTKVKRLVFVCHGNICRSPLAEAVARKYNLPTTSFGLDTRGGAPADPRAVVWANANGYDLDQHLTRRIDQYIPQEGDLLIGMEPKHVLRLKKIFLEKPVQITLAGLWLPKPLAYLHDPYSTNKQYFERCESLVNLVVIRLKEKLQG
jgi:protein-tyrosine phosphatase